MADILQTTLSNSFFEWTSLYFDSYFTILLSALVGIMVWCRSNRWQAITLKMMTQFNDECDICGTLKDEDYHDANLVVTGGTIGCHSDILWCYQCDDKVIMTFLRFPYTRLQSLYFSIFGIPVCISCVSCLSFGRRYSWTSNVHCPSWVLCLIVVGPYTVECRYNVVKYNLTLHTSLQELRQNINRRLNSQKTPIPRPNRQAMGRLLQTFWRKLIVL